MPMTSSLSARSVARTLSSLALTLALPFVTQLGACVEPSDDASDAPKCTLVDCSNGVSLELAPGKPLREAACARGPLTLRVCAGSSCAETELSVYGECAEGPWQGDPQLTCSGSLGRPGDSALDTPPLRVELSLGVDFRGGPQPVSVALRSASGETLYQGQRSVLFEKEYPNGRECGGACWQGELTAFDLSAALAGLGEGCDPDRPGEGGGGQGGQGGGGPSGAGGRGGEGGGPSGAGGRGGEGGGSGGAGGQAGQGGGPGGAGGQGG